jgi:hypothetical protein
MRLSCCRILLTPSPWASAQVFHPKHLAQLAKKSIRWFIHLTVENSLRTIEIVRND